MKTTNIRIVVYIQHSSVQCKTVLYRVCLLRVKPQIQELLYVVYPAYFSTVQYNTVQGIFMKSENPQYKNCYILYIQHISVQCSTTVYRVCLLKVKTPNTRIVVCSINNIFQFNILMFKLIVNIWNHTEDFTEQ